jgi:hypothetical protein
MSQATLANQTLAKPLRSQLEKAVKAARDIAEHAAQAALTQLAVGEAKVPDYLTDEQKALRRTLRTHGRALGDTKLKDGTQEVQHLVWEVAYEHWHRMLFARFLAESGLLLWELGAAVSLDDCRDMVDNHPELAQGAKSQWELASKLAGRMLPQVFKADSPAFELHFAPESQRELEKLLANLPPEVFQASDSLGWVYQFWQAKRKEAVNKSEVKIGADELPAVTQLFTEPYMVDFLLHNSLGAWWLTRHPDLPCPVPMPYLRTLEDGSPAAGKFEGWPNKLSDFKLLDPCCGSGHFLVAAFLLLVPLRMADEGLSAQQAVDKVLQQNLHGLEIDPRCVEIAVFALALTAWRYPDNEGNALGVRAAMPTPNIACCGLKVAGRAQDWAALVPNDAENAEHLREGLKGLHQTFVQAPLLGSLLDPSKANAGDLFAADYRLLGELLDKALAIEQQPTLLDDADGQRELALSAQGLLEAARLLEQRYDLVITNVPYLARGKQAPALKNYCESHYPTAKNDLANVFLERCLELSIINSGVVQIVMPQNWLFLVSYKKQREELLKTVTWNLIIKLGAKGFQTPMWDFNVQLLTQTNTPPDEQTVLCGVDVSAPKNAREKAEGLISLNLKLVNQKLQLSNPDNRIGLDEGLSGTLLSSVASALNGMHGADSMRFRLCFWEISDFNTWHFFQCTDEKTRYFGGKSHVFFWANDGEIHRNNPKAFIKGEKIWRRRGVAVSMMRDLPVTLYSGDKFDISCTPIVPYDVADLSAIWCFCSSPEFNIAVRKIDQSLKVTNATLAKVPFDLLRWQKVALERYSNGLPHPYSDDPTQWIFHSHPKVSIEPLQVGVARLLGYEWPSENSEAVEISNEAKYWVESCKRLAKHSKQDGIVCLHSVRGELPAHDQLLALLVESWESIQSNSWSPAVLEKLLTNTGMPNASLASWLRDQFFEQHAKLFQHRPFIWHIWDGLKDGFAALVNYHKLDTRNLERLIHTYLGDWVRTQEAGVENGVDGANVRLAAALNLKQRLQAILEGEAPYDIFVRWKPLAEQPIGWNPDLNDGVRVNIRPFMLAEVLRHNKKPKLNITWDKDRGKDIESAPWFKVFNGERINDHHLTLAEKKAAAKE